MSLIYLESPPRGDENSPFDIQKAGYATMRCLTEKEHKILAGYLHLFDNEDPIATVHLFKYEQHAPIYVRMYTTDEEKIRAFETLGISIQVGRFDLVSVLCDYFDVED